MKYKRVGKTHHFIFNVVPVPASRPRVSRWGTYYGKTYKAYRKAFEADVAEFRKKFRPLLGRLRVDKIRFMCAKPKNPSNDWPIGDIDNYLKALWDSCNELVWRDDVQITDVGEIIKRYSKTPYIGMTVTEIDDEAIDS